MRLEERVRAAIAEERTVTEQSLGRSARRLRDRRDALHGVRDGLNRGAADIGVIEVADAALALEAAVEGVRSAQGHLRRLGSSAEFERRLQRTRRKSAEGDGTLRLSGGAGASCPSAPEQIDGREPRTQGSRNPKPALRRRDGVGDRSRRGAPAARDGRRTPSTRRAAPLSSLARRESDT